MYSTFLEDVCIAFKFTFIFSSGLGLDREIGVYM